MPRTAIPVTELVSNSSIANPAGTAVDTVNNHSIVGSSPLEELYLLIDATFAGAKNYTIKAGANPPALNAGQGDLVVAINAAKRLVGPFTSARFSQKDGSLNVDVEAGATGTITAVHVPRSA